MKNKTLNAAQAAALENIAIARATMRALEKHLTVYERRAKSGCGDWGHVGDTERIMDALAEVLP